MKEKKNVSSEPSIEREGFVTRLGHLCVMVFFLLYATLVNGTLSFFNINVTLGLSSEGERKHHMTSTADINTYMMRMKYATLIHRIFSVVIRSISDTKNVRPMQCIYFVVDDRSRRHFDDSVAKIDITYIL